MRITSDGTVNRKVLDELICAEVKRSNRDMILPAWDIIINNNNIIVFPEGVTVPMLGSGISSGAVLSKSIAETIRIRIFSINSLYARKVGSVATQTDAK